MRFDAPAAGIWKIRVYHTLSIQGEYHMWLPVHGFISDETFFLRPDPDTIITDPGNTAAIITTAAYSHQAGGDLSAFQPRFCTRTRNYQARPCRPRRPAPASRLSGGNRNLICRRHDRRSRRDPALLVRLYAISPADQHLDCQGISDPPLTAEIPSNIPAGVGYGTLNLYNSFLSMRS